MSGFNSITKYKNIVAEQGITSAQNSIDSAANIVKQAESKEASIWNSVKSSSSENDSIIVNEPNYSVSSAKMSGAQKWAIASTALTGLAQLAGNFFANSAAEKAFGNTGAAASNDSAPAQKAVSTIKTTNDLSDAISSYNKKASDKHSTKLTKELGNAKDDKSKLANLIIEQESIIRENTDAKAKVNEEIATLKKDEAPQQTRVDQLIEELKGQADNEINKINEDNKAQDKAIEDSEKRVDAAKEDCQNTVNAQKDIISKNKEMANATATPIKDPTTGAVTGWNPSQEQINTAKKAIENAEKAIKDAEEKRDEVIKAEEEGDESVQGKAKAQKAKNLEEIATWEAKKQNPSSEELTAAKELLCKTREDISSKEASVKTCDANIEEAGKKKAAANQQMIAMSQSINEAEALLANKKS